MSRRSELRELVIERSLGQCEWSGCRSRGQQMAHVRGLGMGGNPDLTRDRKENVAWLCVYHHDELDGRQRIKLWDVESLLCELIEWRYYR